MVSIPFYPLRRRQQTIHRRRGSGEQRRDHGAEEKREAAPEERLSQNQRTLFDSGGGNELKVFQAEGGVKKNWAPVCCFVNLPV